jgi:acetyl esterase/lipase
MDIQKIHPELRPIYKYLPAIPFRMPFTRSLMRFALRLARRPRPAAGVAVENHRIGPARIRVYRPLNDASGAGLLWMHGGGFVVGAAVQDEGLCSRYARDLGLVVVSVDYRLAPEHPFPAALDDCFAAWRWMQDSPDLNIDPTRIAVGGMSAGSGLAACLAQRILDSGGIQPAAQTLIYPMLDDQTAVNRDLDLLQHPLWNNKNNHAGWLAYLGHEPGQSSDLAYAVTARRQDLAGLPPAWIGVGDIDLFFDENRIYSERLNSASVSCDLHVVPMAPHGFQVVVPQAQVSREFYEKNYRFLIQTLDLQLEKDWD